MVRAKGARVRALGSEPTRKTERTVVRGAQHHTWRIFFPRVASLRNSRQAGGCGGTNPKWARGAGVADGIAHQGRSGRAREGPRVIVTCSSSRDARVIGDGASRPGAAGARSVAVGDLPPTPQGEDRARAAGGFARAIRR